MSGRRSRIQVKPAIRTRSSVPDKKDGTAISAKPTLEENLATSAPVVQSPPSTKPAVLADSTQKTSIQKDVGSPSESPIKDPPPAPPSRRSRIAARPKLSRRPKESKEPLDKHHESDTTTPAEPAVAVITEPNNASLNVEVTTPDHSADAAILSPVNRGSRPRPKPNIQQAGLARIRRLSESLELPLPTVQQLKLAESNTVKRVRRYSESHRPPNHSDLDEDALGHRARHYSESRDDIDEGLKAETHERIGDGLMLSPPVKRVRHVSGPSISYSDIQIEPLRPISNQQLNLATDDPLIKDHSMTNENDPSASCEIASNHITVDPDVEEELAEKLIRQLEEELSKKQRKKASKIRRTVLSDEAPDTSKMTIKELIYYQPTSNPLIPVEVEASIGNAETAELQKNVSNVRSEAPPEPQTEPDAAQETEPVPQVMIGEDGSIVINESSLVIRQGGAPPPSTEPITYEQESQSATYASYRPNKRFKLWDAQETRNFYRALCAIGSDFTLMCKLFPYRTRTDIKKKFKREEKTNPAKINLAMAGKLNFETEPFEEPVPRLKERTRSERRKESNAPLPKSYIIGDGTPSAELALRLSYGKEKTDAPHILDLHENRSPQQATMDSSLITPNSQKGPQHLFNGSTFRTIMPKKSQEQSNPTTTSTSPQRLSNQSSKPHQALPRKIQPASEQALLSSTSVSQTTNEIVMTVPTPPTDAVVTNPSGSSVSDAPDGDVLLTYQMTPNRRHLLPEIAEGSLYSTQH